MCQWANGSVRKCRHERRQFDDALFICHTGAMHPVYVAQKAVLVREDGRILALRRSKTDQNRPLTWDLPGGDVEFGEDLTESIKREVREEAGIEVKDLTLLDAIGRVTPQNEYWVSLGYFARVPQDTEVTVSWEHDQYEWLTREEFLARESSSRIKRFLENVPIER